MEEEKAELEAEISELQKEKERLEFVLVAHQPSCKIPYQEQQQASMPLQQQPPAHPQLAAAVSVVGLSVKEDSFYLPPAYSSHLPQLSAQTSSTAGPPQPGMMQEVAFSTSFYGHVELAQGSPCPAAAPGGGAGGGNNHEAAPAGGGCCNPSYTSSFVFTYPEGACGASATQWTSSSEQSSDSLNSPSLLAL